MLEGKRSADAEIGADGQQAGVEGAVVDGAGGDAVAQVEPLAIGGGCPRFDVGGDHEPVASERAGVKAAEGATVLVLIEDATGEAVLSEPDALLYDPRGLQLAEVVRLLHGFDVVGAAGDGQAELMGTELVLAEQVGFGRDCQPIQEIWHLDRIKMLGSRCLDGSEVKRSELVSVAAQVEEELGLAAGAVGTEPFEIEHLVGERADRPLECGCQGMHGVGEAVSVGTAELVWIDEAEEPEAE